MKKAFQLFFYLVGVAFVATYICLGLMANFDKPEMTQMQVLLIYWPLCVVALCSLFIARMLDE